MNLEALAVVVSVIGGIAGVAFGIASQLRSRKKDDAENGKQDGIVLTELGYIKAGVDDLKRKQDTQDTLIMKLVTDQAATTESLKVAHKRIDGIEDRLRQ
jgi:hypothetical protein